MPDPAPQSAAVPRADGAIHHIPLDQIDADALPRDRTAADPAAFEELVASIAAGGLRMPVELFGLAGGDADAPAYGLISGWRRLRAVRVLRETDRTGAFETIPALLRNPADLAGALAAMVEENEIRADLSPWERAAIAVTARDRGFFESIEAAVDGLYPAAPRQKRTRLRDIAFLVHETDGILAEPETLSQNQLLRLHAAWTRGFGPLVATALTETTRRDAAHQWDLLRPILAEAEAPEPEYAPHERREGRPRRVSRPRRGLTLRREMTPDGWTIHLTGREARSALVDHIFEEIERLIGER